MTPDPLRDRIARADPALGGAAPPPITSEPARTLLEAVMSTPTDIPTDRMPDASGAAGPERAPSRRRWYVTGAAAAAVAAVAIGAAAIGGAFDGDEPSVAEPAPTAPVQLRVLELSTGEVDPSMQMCMQITPELIADAQVAFKATVDAVDADIVTMTIDQWYQGGDAQVVTLTAPQGMEALIGGLAFSPGTQYLVTATDGVVNYCGMTGEATPELQSLFDQAFPG